MMAERGWRVGHQGRDQMYYEELQSGSWQRIEVQGEMLMGPAHHVIYFASSEKWREYPAWARERRDEIIARIKSEFRAPDYEYYGGDASGTPKPSAPVAPAALAPVSPKAARAPVQGMRAVMIAIVVVLAIGAGMTWLVVNGLTTGATVMPTRRATPRRAVARDIDPVMYWTSIGIYATIGLGTFALGVWGIREARKLRT